MTAPAGSEDAGLVLSAEERANAYEHFNDVEEHLGRCYLEADVARMLEAARAEELLSADDFRWAADRLKLAQWSERWSAQSPSARALDRLLVALGEAPFDERFPDANDAPRPAGLYPYEYRAIVAEAALARIARTPPPAGDNERGGA